MVELHLCIKSKIKMGSLSFVMCWENLKEPDTQQDATVRPHRNNRIFLVLSSTYLFASLFLVLVKIGRHLFHRG